MVSKDARDKMSGRSQIHRGEEHDFNFFPPTDVGMPSKAMEILRGVNAIQQAPLGSRRPQGVPSVPVRPFSGCASTREEVEAHRQYQATREADAATAALDGASVVLGRSVLRMSLRNCR